MNNDKLKSSEIKNLKKLENYINIIPIICFGDFYSKEEILTIK